MYNLNKKYIILTLVLLGIGGAILTGFSDSNQQRNELDYMKGGKEDPVIKNLYLTQQQEVSDITNGDITIKYVDVDLNNDGLEDKIVIIRSPLHSGSHGDMFEILLNDNGNYNTVFYGVFRLYSQEWESVGTVTVLNETNNGLKNIIIKSSEEPTIIQFNGNSYQ